jgi:hypothetical protein
MNETVTVYSVHQNVAPLLIGLCVGWCVTLLGSIRWGSKFAAVALPLGLLIPAGQFLLRVRMWRALLDPEIVAWNAAYWLFPAMILVLIALAIRKRRAS